MWGSIRALIVFGLALLGCLPRIDAATVGHATDPSIVGHANNPSVVGHLIVTGGGSCTAGSGETVLGNEDIDSYSSKTSGTIMISKFTSVDACDVDELSFSVNGLTDSEHIVIGLYDASGNKIYQTAEQVGIAGGGSTTITASITSYSMSASTVYHIVAQADAGFNAAYAGPDAIYEGTKNISGTYSSTLPASVDVSGLTANYSFAMSGATP